MGEEIGAMYTKDIPEFFVKLGKTVVEAGTDYETFYQKNPEKVKEIAKEFI